MSPALPDQLVSVLLRHIELPTPEEAQLVGDLIYDRGGGDAADEALCTHGAARRLTAVGPAAFLKAHQGGMQHGASIWPQGVVTRQHPMHLMSALLEQQAQSSAAYLVTMAVVAVRLREDAPRGCLVYGASDLGILAVQALQLFELPVVAIVDRNPLLSGAQLGGVDVRHPTEVGEADFDTVIVAATLNTQGIMNDIRAGILGARPRFRVMLPMSGGEEWIE